MLLLFPFEAMSQDYQVYPQIDELMPKKGIELPFSAMPICKDKKYNIYVGKSDNNITYDFSYAVNGVPGKTVQFKPSSYTQSGKPHMIKMVCDKSNNLGVFISDIKDASNNMKIDYPHENIAPKNQIYNNSVYSFFVDSSDYEPHLLLNSELVNGVEVALANEVSSNINDKLVSFDVASIDDDFVVMYYTRDKFYYSKLKYIDNAKKFDFEKGGLVYQSGICNAIADNNDLDVRDNSVSSNLLIISGKPIAGDKCDYSKYIKKEIRMLVQD